ncbi:universal stress protein [Streptomyces sp. NPDC002004]
MDTDASKPRVVVGVDGSSSSRAALRWAVRYTDSIGGDLEAVAVWDLPGMRIWAAPPVDADLDEENARELFTRELTEVLGSEGAASVRAVLVRGNPAEMLLSAAVGAEALVVGSRGRGGFARALLGSVSQQVALHATCPVVIVRPESA